MQVARFSTARECHLEGVTLMGPESTRSGWTAPGTLSRTCCATTRFDYERSSAGSRRVVGTPSALVNPQIRGSPSAVARPIAQLNKLVGGPHWGVWFRRRKGRQGWHLHPRRPSVPPASQSVARSTWAIRSPRARTRPISGSDPLQPQGISQRQPQRGDGRSRDGRPHKAVSSGYSHSNSFKKN